MGRIFRVYLDGHVYSCNYCQTHLSLASTLLSKCNHGKAYLFDKAVNVTLGEKEDRFMMTGLHTVADIFCVGCSSLVGWKYVAAFEKSQKYKEGKFILERYKVLGPDGSTYAVAQEVAGSDDEDP